jgi:hypothetical protein
MALISTVPTSQKAGDRPISFHLYDGPKLDTLFLIVRPEDLTRVEPSRMSLQQTLSSDNQGWLDNFGPGLPTINISGHTGWRDINGSGDGVSQFEKLNKMVMTDWHAARQRRINAGQDPSDVRLLFVDKLDSFAYVVAPQSFTLRRSRSRPLLMQYQISLQAIGSSVDPSSSFGFASSPDLLSELGLDSLRDVLGNITTFAEEMAGYVTGTIGKLATSFLKMSTNVLGVVSRVVGTIKGAIDKVTGAFLGVAGDIMKAGRNIFMAIAAVMSFPDYVKHRFMQIAAAFNNAFCVIKNVFKVRKTLPNYSDWYGASTCSSTAGGAPLSPLRNTNAFYLLTTREAPPMVMSKPAAESIRNGAAMDPVLAPPPLATSTEMLRDISSGVALA